MSENRRGDFLTHTVYKTGIYGYGYIHMDIHEKSVDVDIDLDGKFHIYGNPAKYSSHIDNTTISNNLAIIGDSVIYCNELCGILCYLAGFFWHGELVTRTTVKSS